ncbi:MAG: phosphatidylcholine/phosphatidylserine synthase [Candidatus Puniceispirillum sp.]|uniref:CDP-alcohol phosphatidyltransferase family protein n=1 Tax=Candidatus Puniceispirillum sp. TaxID=2026719 RepID=UPI001EBD11DE|nr:phosphatidylcholine/phosphatidylserine synthase [Candidatus Puniceispirillum sp.]MBT6416461.1 phosphatidylcholine/phosphatidylserine synthase [Candidatus Puniceispirillum sp.]MBT6566107.1 phosphatidylcholine/phosphatidylserine synthase [Candidatus Puniceispirillum sp.]
MSDANLKPHNQRFRSVSIYWLLPNMLTIGGFVSGLTALRFALDGRWAGVIVLVALAAVFDALDGRAARKFQTASAFGAALDSLSDLVVFGVVPALSLYLWALQDYGNLAWGATLFYAVSIALRLARFDSELPNPPVYAKNYFTGIPAPAAAFLVLVPICLDLEFNLPWVREALYVSGWLILIGVGAVTALPTFAGKRLKLPVGSVLPILAVVGLLGAGIVTQPWITYLALATVYICSLPLAAVKFQQDRRAYEATTVSGDGNIDEDEVE